MHEEKKKKKVRLKFNMHFIFSHVWFQGTKSMQIRIL